MTDPIRPQTVQLRHLWLAGVAIATLSAFAGFAGETPTPGRTAFHGSRIAAETPAPAPTVPLQPMAAAVAAEPPVAAPVPVPPAPVPPVVAEPEPEPCRDGCPGQPADAAVVLDAADGSHPVHNAVSQDDAAYQADLLAKLCVEKPWFCQP